MALQYTPTGWACQTSIAILNGNIALVYAIEVQYEYLLILQMRLGMCR